MAKVLLPGLEQSAAPRIGRRCANQDGGRDRQHGRPQRIEHFSVRRGARGTPCKELIRRAPRLGAPVRKPCATAGLLCEDQGARFLAYEPVDTASYPTLTNALRRLLKTIGLERRSREVTDLQGYLKGKAA
jgi:hypothetical protein